MKTMTVIATEYGAEEKKLRLLCIFLLTILVFFAISAIARKPCGCQDRD